MHSDTFLVSPTGQFGGQSATHLPCDRNLMETCFGSIIMAVFCHRVRFGP